MIRLADLDRLVALRRMREERAERAVAVQAETCRRKAAMVTAAATALDRHAGEAEERERIFFEKILHKPMPQTALGRVQDGALLSEHQAEALQAVHRAAITLAEEADEELRALAALRAERSRQVDKLAEATRHLARSQARRQEQLSEISAEDDATFRPVRGY